MPLLANSHTLLIGSTVYDVFLDYIYPSIFKIVSNPAIYKKAHVCNNSLITFSGTPLCILTFPILSGRINLNSPATTFLSSSIDERMCLISISSGISEGRPYDSTRDFILRTLSLPINLSLPESSASRHIPIATASPWRYRLYPVAVSIAWPIVCPKFKIDLNPDSLSSFDTTSAFISHERLMICIIDLLSRLRIFFFPASRKLNNFPSHITPYLITSASPERNSLPGKVFKWACTNQAEPRLPECTYHVLPEPVVNACFTPYGTVHLCK